MVRIDEPEQIQPVLKIRPVICGMLSHEPLQASMDCVYRIHPLDVDLVSGDASVMFFVAFSRLVFGLDREIHLGQIDPTCQNDILLAVRKHGKNLGNDVSLILD